MVDDVEDRKAIDVACAILFAKIWCMMLEIHL